MDLIDLLIKAPLYIGATKKGKKLYINEETRKLHMQVIGASGGGKSKFIEFMIRQDIVNNEGLFLMDPHGSLYDKVVKWCAAERVHEWAKPRKIVLVDLTQKDWILGFNPLRLTDTYINVLVDSMVRAVAKVWGDANIDETPRLAKCLTNIFYVLAEKNLSLLEAEHLLNRTDSTLRKILTQDIQEHAIKEEWGYLNSLKPGPFLDELSSSINRMNRFLISPVIQAILGQLTNAIDFRTVMDGRYVLLVKLGGQGLTISQENARLLGTLMINELFLRAKERPEGSRPFYVYIDECYHFINEDIGYILSEGRKFGLHLILAHQFLSQLLKAGQEVHDSVLSGAQAKVVFRGLSPKDAEILGEQMFLGEYDLEELQESSKKPTLVGYEKTILKGRAKAEGKVTTASHGRSGADIRGEGQNQVMSYPNEAGLFCSPGSFAEGVNSFESYLEAWNDSIAESLSSIMTESEMEAYLPILKELPTQYFSLEEQRYRTKALLVRQPKQHAFIQYLNDHSEAILVPTVDDIKIDDKKVQNFKNECYNKAKDDMKILLRMEDALKEIQLRDERLLELKAEYIEVINHEGKKVMVPRREEDEEKESFREKY